MVNQCNVRDFITSLLQIFNPSLLDGSSNVLRQTESSGNGDTSQPSFEAAHVPEQIKAKVEKQKQEDQERIQGLQKITSKEAKRHKVKIVLGVLNIA